MRQFTELLNRFRRDESGAFGLIFAVLAIVLIAMSGAVVDFTSVQQSRTRAQVALDAASLALQPSIYDKSVTYIQDAAQALLIDRLQAGTSPWVKCTSSATPPPCASVNTPVVDVANGRLTLTATLTMPMNFVSLVGVPTMTAQLLSVATRQKLSLEVAMVLDNSGSMGTSFGSGTRLTVLQSSANCAANILFYNVKTCDPVPAGTKVTPDVKMALVPFNDEVNVGPAHASDFWIDRTGGDNTFANDNFGPDTSVAAYTGTMDRVAQFSKITYNGSPLSWGGCVEARINNGTTKQYDTDDTTPVAGNHDTLFAPLFAPDEPDTSYTITSGWRTYTYNYGNNYLSDTPKSCDQVLGSCSIALTTAVSNPIHVVTTTVTTVTDRNGNTTSGPTTKTTTTDSTSTTSTTAAQLTTAAGVVSNGPSVCTCNGETLLTNNTSNSTAGPTTVTDGPTTTKTYTYKNGNVNTTTTVVTTIKTTTTVKTAVNTQTCVAHYSPTISSDRVRQERMCKYNVSGGAPMLKAPKPSSGYGPNADCPANAIQPLTATPATITSAVNSMVASGNTNIQEGAAWGFRVLSPGQPFAEGAPYDKATSKVMIVMTDGENTYDDTGNMNGSELYAAYAYPYNSYDRDSRGATAPSRGRMGDVGWVQSQFAAQINSRLSTTCTNAKAAGITIYTIGLATAATSDPTGNKTLLTNCASKAANAYFPTTATDLTTAFTDIANQLAALRLAQ